MVSVYLNMMECQVRCMAEAQFGMNDDRLPTFLMESECYFVEKGGMRIRSPYNLGFFVRMSYNGYIE